MIEKGLIACMIVCSMGLYGGCNRTEPEPERESSQTAVRPRWSVLIRTIEQGHYTVKKEPPTEHRIGGRLHVEELVELFHYKEAYPWLIRAIDSEDEVIASYARYIWSSSNTQGRFTSEALGRWYDVPQDKWEWCYGMWQPRAAEELKGDQDDCEWDGEMWRQKPTYTAPPTVPGTLPEL